MVDQHDTDYRSAGTNPTGFDVPIAILGFNRPDLLAGLIEHLRPLRPAHVLAVLDGPRPGKAGEAERCEQAFQALKKIDWPCTLDVNRAEFNLGCRKRVSSGVSWVFSRVERAIILEDDCLPDPSFFPYMREMLERYADDPRIVHLSGFNPLGEVTHDSRSYYFTRFPMIWGWAGWRRAWTHYDESLSRWPTARAQWRLFRNLSWLGFVFWNRKFFKIRQGFNTWDYQWTFGCVASGGYSLIPRANLMQNLGFRDDATHTLAQDTDPRVPVKPMGFPLRHPERAEISRVARSDRRVNQKMLESMWPEGFSKKILKFWGKFFPC